MIYQIGVTFVAQLLADFCLQNDVLHQQVDHRLFVLGQLLQRRRRQLVERGVNRREDRERLWRRVETLDDVVWVGDGIVESVEAFVGR